MNQFLRFLKDESGATAIEYGLIIALVVLGAVSILSTIGGQTITPLNKANNAFSR